MPVRWITPADLGTDYQNLEFAQEACDAASEILWALSGRKFSGIVTVTERYCLEETPMTTRAVSGQPVIYDTTVDSYVIRQADLRHNRVRLRGKPIREIITIETAIDGEEIDDTTYAMWERAWVAFRNPISQDIDITYQYGVEPPAAGKMAARDLARQFALLWSGHEEECTLPDRVTSVNRQDVSWVLLDKQDFLDELKTGIYSIDLFLRSVNPDKARARARVFSPDIPRGRRRHPEL